MAEERTIIEPPGVGEGRPAVGNRIVALDSLRGIAALVVVFHHLDAALDPDWHHDKLGRVVNGTPLRLLVDGRSAVMLFFVLSGFALSISIGKNFNYWSYLVKRVCRLMMPCVVAVLLAAGAYLAVRPQPIPVLGSWFNSVLWNEPVTPGMVARHILMTGTEADSSLINVLWSLVIELRISLIFPALYFLARGRTWSAAVLSVVTYLAFWYLEVRSDNFAPFFNRNGMEALLNVGYYAPFFVAGILIRENQEALRRAVARLPKLAVYAGLLVALRLDESGMDIQIGLGVLLILTLCVSAPFLSRALSIPPIEWLGRVSYSLYLVHLTVLATVFHVFYGKFNTYLLSVAVVILSFLLAEVFYRLVEEPSMRLGRRLTAKKAPTLVVV